MRRRGPGKADGGSVRSWTSGEQSCTREGREKEGKPAGDDAHLHAELQQWAGATERQDSGVPELGGEGGSTARVTRQGGGDCSICGA
jgi:hypothetical protein